MATPLPAYKNMIVGQLEEHRDTRLEYDVLAEYPAGSGKEFACSTQAQADWGNLVSLDTVGAVPYPFTVYTYDSRDSYDLVDSADLAAAVAAIGAAVLTERGLCQSYVDAVLAAPDEAAVDAAAAPYLAM